MRFENRLTVSLAAQSLRDLHVALLHGEEPTDGQLGTLAEVADFLDQEADALDAKYERNKKWEAIFGRVLELAIVAGFIF